MKIVEIILEDVSDPKVVELQTQLKAKGYDLGTFGVKGDGIDGILGPWTQAAIEAAAANIPPEKAKKPAAGTPNTPTTSSSGFGINPNKISGGIGLKPDAGTSGFGLKVPVSGPISSPFGMRSSGNHLGVDIAVPIGTPIKAPADGTIQRAGTNGGNAGTFVVLDSGGELHKFFHLSKIVTPAGTQVKQGDIIGLTGNTGRSTGPHLHWEKHVAGRPVNPVA